MPELANKCINSWRTYLPEYEIMEWNEENFDVNIIPYTREAYSAKKYAFVSDYARFWILYNYGGLYFDTDVEVIKPMDEMIKVGPFMACEDDRLVYPYDLVAPGLGLCAEKGMPIYQEIMEHYENDHFFLTNNEFNLNTVVNRTTGILEKHGYVPQKATQLVAGLTIFPHDYMCPIRMIDGKLIITSNTVSIHHYAASWTTPAHRFVRKCFASIGGLKLKMLFSKLKQRFNRV